MTFLQVSHILTGVTFLQLSGSLKVSLSYRCGCGRDRETHTKKEVFFPPRDTWDVTRHTELLGTDSYGTIEFQGGPHPIKAQVGPSM